MMTDEREIKLKLDGGQIIQVFGFGGTTLVTIGQLLTAAQLRVHEAEHDKKQAQMRIDFERQFMTINSKLDVFERQFLAINSKLDVLADERKKRRRWWR